MKYTIWLSLTNNDANDDDYFVDNEHIITFDANSDEEAIERMAQTHVKSLCDYPAPICPVCYCTLVDGKCTDPGDHGCQYEE